MDKSSRLEKTDVSQNFTTAQDVSKKSENIFEISKMYKYMFGKESDVLNRAKNLNAWSGYVHTLLDKELKVKKINENISKMLKKKQSNIYRLNNTKIRAKNIDFEINKFNPNKLLTKKRKRSFNKLKTKYADDLSYISRLESRIGENISDVKKLRLQKLMDGGGALSQFNILPRLKSTKGWEAALKESTLNNTWQLMKDVKKAVTSGNKLGRVKTIGKNIKLEPIASLRKTGEMMKQGQDLLTSGNKLGKLSKMVKNIPIKKTISKLKPLSQLLGPLNAAANMHTIAKDKSAFKKLLAGADLVGDFTPLGPVTSVLNTVLPAIYDGLGDTNQDRLDEAATKAINFGKNIIKKSSILPNLRALKNSKSIKEKLSAGMDIASKLSPFGLAKSLAKNTLSTAYDNLGNENKRKINDFTASIKSSIGNTLQATGRHLARPSFISRDMENKSTHNNREVLKEQLLLRTRGVNYESKPLIRPVENSTKNNLTIQINGENLTPQKIADKLVPEINLRMKNMSTM